MTKSKSNTVVEGRIGNPSFAELLRGVIRDRHGDRLSEEEIEEAALVAKGVYKMDSSDNALSAGRDGQIEVLRNKFGINYDEVARGAKSLRITGETPDSPDNVSPSSPDYETIDGLLQEIDDHDADSSELLLVHDPDGDISELLNEIADADDTTPGDVGGPEG